MVSTAEKFNSVKTSVTFLDKHILYGQSSGFPDPVSWCFRLRKKKLQIV